jgi:hypothetical protein
LEFFFFFIKIINFFLGSINIYQKNFVKK